MKSKKQKIYISYVMSRIPKIPVGITAMSTTSLALGVYGAYNAKRRDVRSEATSGAQKFISDFSFDKIYDSINSYYSFIFTLSLEAQLAFFNFLISAVFLVLLSSTAINLYSQYLIDRFKIGEKYPRLYKLLEFRKTIQSYHRYYNLILGLYFIFLQLFINLYAFISLL